MKARYILAPEAARDLVQIWRYVKKESGRARADQIEADIRSRCVFLAEFPGAGHTREDLTAIDVRFLSIYSYLIVYRQETHPVEVASILHGSRDVAEILTKRLRPSL